MRIYILMTCSFFLLFSFGFKPEKKYLVNKPQLSHNRNFHDSLLIKKRAKLLKIYFSRLPDSVAQEMFFNYFPRTFKDFKDIFGYQKIDAYNLKFGPLYDESQDYIDAFFTKLLNINQAIIIKRVINIAQDGQWQYDGVNIFQLYLQENMNHYLKSYLEELTTKNDKLICGFWHFYFDGPHPEKYIEDYKLLYMKIKKIDITMAELMKQSYQQLLLEHDRHIP